MKNRVTILHVAPSGPRHVVVWFKSTGGGTKNWPHIVDGFGDELCARHRERGLDWTPPSRGQSLGQGLRLKIGRKMYLRLRSAFLEMEEVAEAFADGSFVIKDEWLLSEAEGEDVYPEDAP